MRDPLLSIALHCASQARLSTLSSARASWIGLLCSSPRARRRVSPASNLVPVHSSLRGPLVRRRPTWLAGRIRVPDALEDLGDGGAAVCSGVRTRKGFSRCALLCCCSVGYRVIDCAASCNLRIIPFTGTRASDDFATPATDPRLSNCRLALAFLARSPHRVTLGRPSFSCRSASRSLLLPTLTHLSCTPPVHRPRPLSSPASFICPSAEERNRLLPELRSPSLATVARRSSPAVRLLSLHPSSFVQETVAHSRLFSSPVRRNYRRSNVNVGSSRRSLPFPPKRRLSPAFTSSHD